MGTPEFALEILKKLYEADECIVGVVCQPDKPSGRGHKMKSCPTKIWAEENGIEVFQPQTLRDEAFLPVLERLSPDIIVVAAYGKILPSYIINYPRYGCINAHASLLPKYRGAAPIQRALINGESESGVTAMKMDEGLDTGDIIFVEKVEISPSDNFESLHDKLAAAGGEAILKTVRWAKENKAYLLKKQDSSLSTYAEKITGADRIIDFSIGAEKTYNLIRALSPFPRAFCVMPNGKKLQITAARLADCAADAPSGTVLFAAGEGFTVSCGDGALEALEVIPEGRGKMSGAALIRGRGLSVGDVLRRASDVDRTSEKNKNE